MRKLEGAARRLMYAYIVLLGAFHIYTSVFGNFEAYLQRSVHLSLVLPLAFIFWPASKKMAGQTRVPLYDWLLAAISLSPGAYIVANYSTITSRIVQIDPVTTAQFVLGIALIVLLLESARRVVGLPLAIIAGVFIFYMKFGEYMPGIFKGISFDAPAIIEQVFLTDEGIFGSPLGVSATYVMVFLIFGGFLEKSGVGPYFMEMAQALTGTQPGGPAQIAVSSSCLFGSISGSAVANVYGTGTFTIPLMKRLGYAPHFAGAVEAVASTGGQLMPPVMGAGAFLMASFLGLPYKAIMVAAILPAFLYYGAVFLMVRLEALKKGLKGLPREELPSIKGVLRRLYMVLPLVGIVYFLLSGLTPMRAAIFGTGIAWVVSFFNPKTEDSRRRAVSYIAGTFISLACVSLFFMPDSVNDALGSKTGLAAIIAVFAGASFLNAGMSPRDVIDAIYEGAKGIPLIAIACAAAGIVLGAVALTGIGGKLVAFMLSFAGSFPFVGLFFVMVITIILGMGLPTTGAYILGAALGAPILVKLGFIPLAAHMFVFYFAVISNITPPVALAAFAASSISGAPPNKTGWTACRLGFLAFVVPYAFCYDPGLLLNGGAMTNLLALASGIICLFAFGYFWIGYITRPIPIWLRGLLFVAGIAALSPYAVAVASAGLAVLGAFLFSKFAKPRGALAAR